MQKLNKDFLRNSKKKYRFWYTLEFTPAPKVAIVKTEISTVKEVTDKAVVLKNGVTLNHGTILSIKEI